MTHSKTLFLSWQDKARTNRWFPVGRLDTVPVLDVQTPRRFRFRFTQGVEKARREAGFPGVLDFPDSKTGYESDSLFPLFSNRVMTPRRPDFQDYLRQLGLSGNPDPLDILAVSGGVRVTDNFEVFPKFERGEDGSFQCRFLLHGWRHINDAAQRRIEALKGGEELRVSLELNNPATGFAVQLQTSDYVMIGWTPRHLSTVFRLPEVMAHASNIGKVRVVRVNPVPAPSNQRLLVEFEGRLPEGVDPMGGEEFQPLAP